MLRRKQIASTDITGEKGIALIYRTVLDMEFLWNATKLEAGIDGYIEIRNAKTSEVTNCILQVQSKAGPSWFKAETEDAFEFLCNERDLNYWLAGNAPVILVVSRPDRNEAYWVSIKDYFRDPLRQKERKICFNKRTDRFDVSCRERLAALAVPVESGLYLSALPREETLVCNLLPLKTYPQRLFRASTKLLYPGQVWEILRRGSDPPKGEWLLHGGFIYAFHDLTLPQWSGTCLAATTENLSATEWALSEDANKRYAFARLLTMCMEQLLYRQTVRFSKDKEHYFFSATPNRSERKVGGLSVFKGYPSKTNPERIAYYRHRAMRTKLSRFEGQWYLEITPSYHFTQDGVRLSRYFEERLSTIKSIEKQNKVHLRQLRLWAEILQQTHVHVVPAVQPQQHQLFEDTPNISPTQIEPYSLIAFGPLVTFQADYGVPESAWLPVDDGANSEDDLAQGRLFE